MDSKLDKLIEQRLQKITEKTIYTSPDGTEKTLTGDQKLNIKKVTDKGDGVEIKKKGDIKEGAGKDLLNKVKNLFKSKDTKRSEKIQPLIDKYKEKDISFTIRKRKEDQSIGTEDVKAKVEDIVYREDRGAVAIKLGGGIHEAVGAYVYALYGKDTVFIDGEGDYGIAYKVVDEKDIKPIMVDIKSLNVKEKLNEEDGGGDSGEGTGDPIDTGDQNDTVQHLYQIGLGFGGHLAKKKKKMTEVKKNSSATKIKRYMENAEKYMNKVNEELKKAIEHETKMLDEAEQEDNKKTNKFSDQVRHELSKMLKDKALVASAMEKYAGVMKTVKDEHDPKKIAKSILSTALKAKKPATA